MNGFPESDDKQTWRVWAKAQRRELDMINAFEKVKPILLQLSEWRNARRILLYCATATEINLNSLIRDGMGKEWYLPRCIAGNNLAIHRVFSASLSGLKQNRFGIHEPHPDSPEIAPGGTDLVIVPALAFDERGNRLGYGGGFYDRFLPRLRPDAVTVGLTLDALMVPALPAEPHDVPVQIVVTETRTIRRADTTGQIPPPCSD
ncbi:MAG: 5-formyltetrahydrofolate cyclo-ligase [Fibrella sp.]|nr:5-formyltetrahydrofolate cyclo-ligase [Armatimonadota bacterium]